MIQLADEGAGVDLGRLRQRAEAAGLLSAGQVVSLDKPRPAGTPGWVGLLPLKGGTLLVAQGGVLVGDLSAPRPGGRGLVLRGRRPTADPRAPTAGLPGSARGRWWCPIRSLR